jgi:hypothetical protein
VALSAAGSGGPELLTVSQGQEDVFIARYSAAGGWWLAAGLAAAGCSCTPPDTVPVAIVSYCLHARADMHNHLDQL